MAFGKVVGFKSRCLRQWGSRLAKFLCFGFWETRWVLGLGV
jgi:hypothetical protein